MLPCHYADKVLNDRDRYSAAHAGLANCSTAQRFVRTASTSGGAIGTDLMGACMKRDQFKRLIVLMRRKRGYLTKAFSSRGFYPHESAVNFILVGTGSLTGKQYI